MHSDILFLELRLLDVLPLVLSGGENINLILRTLKECFQVLLARGQNTLHLDDQILGSLLGLLQFILFISDLFDQQVVKLSQIHIEAAKVLIFVQIE